MTLTFSLQKGQLSTAAQVATTLGVSTTIWLGKQRFIILLSTSYSTWHVYLGVRTLGVSAYKFFSCVYLSDILNSEFCGLQFERKSH